MFSLKLSNISHKKFTNNHSITQDSMILTPSFSLLPKTPQRPFFSIKRVQQPSTTVIIRPVPNLRPYEYTSASSLVEKARSKDKLDKTQISKDMLNVTDAFQYRCEGLLDDVLTSTHSISKVRRKSDVSSLSGGASTFERKIGSLMHESLLTRNKKPVTLYKSNSTSPSKFRSSVKKMMTMRGVVQGWKKLGNSKDLKDGKPKGLNRSNSTLDPNASIIKQTTIRREESLGLINGGNQDSSEVLKLSKVSELDKENSRDLTSKCKTNEKNGNEFKLQQVLKDIKMANENNISNQEYKLTNEKMLAKSVKKISKSVEKKNVTGKKRKAIKAFKIEDSQIINLRKKAADVGNENDKLNISNNSLDEKLEDLSVTERVNQKQGSSIIDNYSLTGEFNEFPRRELPTIKEEKGVKSQTDKLEKIKKSDNKKWIHWNGVKSLAQLANFAEKRSTSPIFKNYFHLGNKKVVEAKSSTKITKSLKIDDAEKNIDLTRETKATRDQRRRNHISATSRRLFTPKISSNKQITTTYSSSNIVSP